MAKPNHTKKSTTRSLHSSKTKYLRHELLHGFYLVHQLLQIAGQDGKAPPMKDRRLRLAYDKAVDATWRLYQEAGRVSFGDDG